MGKNKQQVLEDISSKLLITNIEMDLANQAISLSYEDSYLYDLLLDWSKENNNSLKKEMHDEIINYTEEILRLGNKNGQTRE